MAHTTVRQQILEYVRRRNGATATEVAQALSMTAPAVRHHLGILAADGRIVGERRIARPKRGRPEKAYRISDQLAGDNFAVLSDLALCVRQSAVEPMAQDTVIPALAKGLADRIGAIDAAAPATRRMVLLVERLNAFHYQARWEAGAEGPRILFAHCPYAAIIEQHPELCTMDNLCLSQMMNAPVEQLAKISRVAGGPSQCVFVVKRPAARGD